MQIKKILAVASAAVTLGTCSAFGASAANNLVAPASYDINKDGVVNISDAVAIELALMGNWAPNDLSTLDANGNGIVDDLDRMSIMGYVAQVGIPSIVMK